MGYFIELVDSDFTIPTEHLREAYDDMCYLNRGKYVKSGSGCCGGEEYGRWFSWMSEDYPRECKDAQAIFEMLGFDTTMDDEGLHLRWYDSKTGQEDIFLIAVAPYVKSGSYLRFRGEDGDIFTYDFSDGKVSGAHPYMPCTSDFLRQNYPGEYEPTPEDLDIIQMLESRQW